MSNFLATSPAAVSSVLVSERPASGFFQLAVWPDSVEDVASILSVEYGFPSNLSPGSSHEHSSVCVMAVGPGRYLLQCEFLDRDERHQRLRDLIPSTLGSVTDLSQSRRCFCVRGEASAYVLAKGLPLDFHEDAFPVGRVVQSALHEMAVLVRRVGVNEFDIYVYRSFAEDLLHWLNQATD